jgi:predicted deacetylase
VIPFPAQYLLRFDDLCPTVSAKGWQRCEDLIRQFRLKPILAIVPENRDPELQCSPRDPVFWERMRVLEAAGAITGLHGFRHLCLNEGRSLVGFHRRTEFAGISSGKQRVWIHAGLRILRGYGLHPRIWVAPRHGFDRRTLHALRAEGISLLSDGLARMPFLRGGITWIPQQLWGPAEKLQGIWTICLHPNTVGEEQIAALRAFVANHSAQFTSVDEVLLRYRPTTLTLGERIYTHVALWRRKSLHSSRALRRLAALRSSSSS